MRSSSLKTALRGPNFFVFCSFLCGIIGMAYLGLHSSGMPIHDEAGHYLISRDGWHDHHLIFNTWGRTLNTLIYLVPAQFGLGGARLFSLLMAVAIALLTYATAQELSLKYAFLVPFFLWFQPWFADLSYMCITEVPFSLAMIAGVYLHLTKRSTVAATVIGLLPLIRHEGVALAGLYFLFLINRRRWMSAVMCFVPLGLYNVAYFVFEKAWPFLMFFDSKPTEFYGSGTWYHFFIRLFHPRTVGIPMMCLTFFSLGPIRRNSKLLMVVLWYGSYFALHTVIYRFGLFASGGAKFFLLPMAPLFALATVCGITFIGDRVENIKTAMCAHGRITALLSRNAVMVALCAGCALFAVLTVRPYALNKEGVALQHAAQWLQRRSVPMDKIISTHVYFYLFYPKKVPAKILRVQPPLETMRPGTYVIWDSHYANRRGLDSERLLRDPTTWSPVASFENGTAVVYHKIR